MIDSDQIDRLAAFCRLIENGYWKAATYWDGELLREQWHKDGRAWNPFDSDDDCRVVLEAVPDDKRDALLDAMYCLSGADDDRYDMLEYLTVFEQFLLYASPREKCEAVLRVLGDA